MTPKLIHTYNVIWQLCINGNCSLVSHGLQTPLDWPTKKKKDMRLYPYRTGDPLPHKIIHLFFSFFSFFFCWMHRQGIILVYMILNGNGVCSLHGQSCFINRSIQYSTNHHLSKLIAHLISLPQIVIKSSSKHNYADQRLSSSKIQPRICVSR